MTYFGFLGIFVVIPMMILLAVTVWDEKNGRFLPSALRGYPAKWVLLGHALVALIYTTPWDNYLVATRVWWYDPDLVTGLVIGWVPIEEYTFFILQPFLTGLWMLFLARRLPTPSPQADHGAEQFRKWMLLTLPILGVIMVGILLVGWLPGNYLALEVAWAIPLVLFQIWFGADILWRNRRLILLSLLPATVYLSFADALAIGSGTWTINPAKSLNWYVGGVLPIEEIIFFFLTNLMLTLGVVLVLSKASQVRLTELERRFGISPGLPRHKGGANA